MIPALIFFLLHPHENKSQIMCYNGWDLIFNIMMVYSQKWGWESYNCMSVSVQSCFFRERMVLTQENEIKEQEAIFDLPSDRVDLG